MSRPCCAGLSPKNGLPDLNHFHAAGAWGFMIGASDVGRLLHDESKNESRPRGLSPLYQDPKLKDGAVGMGWRGGPRTAQTKKIVRPHGDPLPSQRGGVGKRSGGPIWQNLPGHQKRPLP